MCNIHINKYVIKTYIHLTHVSIKILVHSRAADMIPSGALCNGILC